MGTRSGPAHMSARIHMSMDMSLLLYPRISAVWETYMITSGSLCKQLFLGSEGRVRTGRGVEIDCQQSRLDSSTPESGGLYKK